MSFTDGGVGLELGMALVFVILGQTWTSRAYIHFIADLYTHLNLMRCKTYLVYMFDDKMEVKGNTV